MEVRTCPKCGETFELTIKYWFKNKTRKSGLSSWCKTCDSRDSKKENGIPRWAIITDKDLPKQGIPNVDMKLGHNYKFIIPVDKRLVDKAFVGKCIQINDRHITLRHKLGYTETFLKWDLNNYKVKEV